jgi:hypothetical protein
MAELPQPAELPRDLVSVVGLINSRAIEFSFERLRLCTTGVYLERLIKIMFG